MVADEWQETRQSINGISFTGLRFDAIR